MAPGGIVFGKKEESEIEVEADIKKTLSGTFGLDDFSEEVPRNTDSNMDWEPIYINSVVNGKNQKIEIRIGKGYSPQIKKRLKRLFSRFSDVFETDESFFPYLKDNSGKPYLHSLNLRPDAVIRNTPTTIKLPPEKSAALAKLIKQKLQNGTFIRIPRNENAFCTPVTVVPKSTFNPDGSRKYRLIQSLINVSENSMHINFKLESARELLEKLPPNSQVFSFFDSVRERIATFILQFVSL